MLLRKIILCTWCIVRPRNPLIYNNDGILSSKPHNLNDLLTNNIIRIERPLSRNFFTSQQLLLASKRKANEKGSKKGKNYVKDEEEEEEVNIRERKFDLNKVETKINVIIERLKKEYGSMRIGHANPGSKIMFCFERILQTIFFIELIDYKFYNKNFSHS